MAKFEERIDPKLQTFITLDDISVTLRQVLKELKDARDEGGKWFYKGTVGTDFTIIDFLKQPPYHEIKSYSLSNDSADDIYFSHNDADNASMNITRQNETIPIIYNRRVVSKLFMKTVSGSSSYRLAVYW